MRKILNPVILLFLLFVSYNLHAQRITEIGLSGGGIRFYPEPQNLGSNLNNRMDNGWGWSAGIFIEDHWKPKIHQIIEINYYNLSSDVFLQKNPTPPWSPYDENDNRKPVYGNYDNTSFNHIAISGGVKYFLNKTLFVYPGFELARALNSDVDMNKTTYNLKLGGGLNLRGVDILLEYAYGLKYQRIVYDPVVPFTTTHRNKYLQLKVQVPLYRLR
jgi:hypothetical protein